MSTQSLNRRSILAGIGSALTLTATTAAVVSTTVQPAAGDAIGDFLEANPDAELIALAAVLAEARAHEKKVSAWLDTKIDAGTYCADDDAAYDAALQPLVDITDRIRDTPARTHDGMRVKIEAIRACLGEEDMASHFTAYRLNVSSEIELALSLVLDVEAMLAVQEV